MYGTLILEAFFLLIRAAVLIFDLVTLPLYTLIQWPFSRWNKIWRKRAEPEVAGDVAGPWVPTTEVGENYYADCNNFTEMMDMAMTRYSSRKCLGYRKLLKATDEVTADGKAVRKSVLENKYTWMTFAEVRQRVERVTKSLYATGIRPDSKVVLLMETSLDYQVVAQALIKMGAVPCMLNTTLGQQGLIDSINETEASHIICSPVLVASLNSFRRQVAKVQCLITSSLVSEKVGAINWRMFNLDDLIRYSSSGRAVVKVKRCKDDLAMIMYTSGSSGRPKGVMMSHGNLMATCAVINGRHAQYEWGKIADQSVYMAYLPMSHIFEFSVEMSQMSLGCSIGFATPLTMLDSSPGLSGMTLGDATILQPTLTVAVPLILDRIKATIEGQLALQGNFYRKIFKLAVNYKACWESLGYGCPLLSRTVFRNTRAILGGNLGHLYLGAAPLSAETQRFLRSALDLSLMQAYGATETMCGIAIMDMWDHSLGTVGHLLPGLKLKLKEWTEAAYSPFDKPNPRGEICISGDNITMGYYKRKQETEESYEVDANGTRWFITGDIGQLEPNGNLKIIDRKKYLVKLQNGEYISLSKVEAVLRSCPYVDNICVYGDSSTNHIVALILPDRVSVSALADTLGKSTSSWSDVCANDDIIAIVLSSVRTVGRNLGLGTKELPIRIKLCPEEWTPATELVTASLKIRRRQLCDYYRVALNQLCQNP